MTQSLTRTGAATLAHNEKPVPISPTFKRHMASLQSGQISRSNIIGLRKAFNADAQRPYQGRTSSKINSAHVEAYWQAISDYKPEVTGDWLESGKAQLASKRYRSRWNPRQAAIIADIATIQLVGIDWIDNRHCTFIYRATGRNGDTLTYINTPWQSGGNGPTVESY